MKPVKHITSIDRLEVCFIKASDKEIMTTLNQQLQKVYNKNQKKQRINHSKMFKLFLETKLKDYIKEYETFLKSFVENDNRLKDKSVKTPTKKELLKLVREKGLL